MSQQDSIAPGQATRLVTATRRQEMAQELARILGRKRTLPLALEVAAAQWEKEREARTKEAGEEKRRPPQATQTSPFSLQRVSLQVKDPPPDDDEGWRSYPQAPKAKPRVRRLGGIPVGSFATRLIQRERGRSRGVGIGFRAGALQEAARRWEERQKAGSPRR